MNGKVAVSHKISNVMAGFMLITALVFDLLQFLLDMTVLLALLTYLVDFLALAVFGIWFALLGVNYFSGRKAGIKLGSVFTSVIIELIPIINAIPAITLGVAGVIASTRLEERADAKKRPSAANDNEVYERAQDAA